MDCRDQCIPRLPTAPEVCLQVLPDYLSRAASKRAAHIASHPSVLGSRMLRHTRTSNVSSTGDRTRLWWDLHNLRHRDPDPGLRRLKGLAVGPPELHPAHHQFYPIG